ncbi:MAG: DUF2235 domain-containing protein, partial [Deferribacteres bacterium]|nr:DUF2235 domain-containing protein [Deferribacteres bacterium]
WDITGIGIWVLNALFKSLDYITDVIFPHRFYNYELTSNVKYACQALAIDDERLSFLPKVWDETERKDGSVEQVWFAGMHSNVGGGYARSGMANVALYWMMERSHTRQLEFKQGAMQAAFESSHVNGRMYNSRDGMAVFYRYHPREIEQLSRGRINGEIKIHSSVLQRMQSQTGNYAPGNLPETFTVVRNAENNVTDVLNLSVEPTWANYKNSLRRLIFFRKWIYGISLETGLVVLMAAIYFWINQHELRTEEAGNWLMAQIADVLNYILPKMFDGLIHYTVALHPMYFWIFVVFTLVLWLISRIAFKKSIQTQEKMRALLLETRLHDFDQ